jgi:phage shock protein PspC (stress-responsive transcriptional regulator)
MSQYHPGPGTSGPKQLRRSRTDRYLGGVCGGVAAYLNMDATLVRILTVVATIFTGVPVVLYLVALFLMPEEDVAPTAPYGRVEQAGDPVWGPAGPPWAQDRTTAPTAAPSDPPRREGDTF